MLKRFYAFFICLFICSPTIALANDKLYVGGDSIGIEVNYDGVMISGTYSLSIDGKMYDPKENGIQAGDRIISVNDQKIDNLQNLYQEISKFKDPINEIPIRLISDNKEKIIYLKTLYHEKNGSFQSGLYVKDKISGIGTVTFYNPKNQTFGALGHEVMDSDLHKIAEIGGGKIFSSKVTSISKAQSNIAGEKHAEIDYQNEMGNIKRNSTIGIYGNYSINLNDRMQLPWAKQSEIKLGKAKIYTVLSNDKIESFDIEITKLHQQKDADVKGIEFTITDERLLEQTNGIVQGMSGSPIVQNDKIIGAITHVITNKPQTGYGVYIEWMLKESSSS